MLSHCRDDGRKQAHPLRAIAFLKVVIAQYLVTLVNCLVLKMVCLRGTPVTFRTSLKLVKSKARRTLLLMTLSGLPLHEQSF